MSTAESGGGVGGVYCKLSTVMFLLSLQNCKTEFIRDELARATDCTTGAAQLSTAPNERRPHYFLQLLFRLMSRQATRVALTQSYGSPSLLCPPPLPPTEPNPRHQLLHLRPAAPSGSNHRPKPRKPPPDRHHGAAHDVVPGRSPRPEVRDARPVHDDLIAVEWYETDTAIRGA